MRRIFVPPEALEGSEARLGSDAHRHLVRVLRLAVGAEVTAFDGRGRQRQAQLVEVGVETVTLALGAWLPESQQVEGVVLLQGIARGEKMDWLIQKACELGAARLLPVLTERVIARTAGERADRKTERWRLIAREAARQCGRADELRIEAPMALEAALRASSTDEARVRYVAWEGGAHTAPALARVLATGARDAGADRGGTAAALLVGPEGGLTEAEVAAAVAAGFQEVSLGPRILRTETAAVVGLTLIQAALGGLDAGVS